MRAMLHHTTLLFICLFTGSSVAVSQTSQCPPNLDFEDGSFINWECRTGVVMSVPGINNVVWNGYSETVNRHTLIPSSSTELDRFGLFPQRCPNGSGYSIRLGNEFSGAEAEGVSFTYRIPANISTFSIIYHYAIVLQDPGHNPEQQPRFMAKVYDVDANSEIYCVSFDFTASSSLPGFRPSPVFAGVVYKDWTPITVDLSAFSGKTVRLEFTTSDCTLGGHFGYAYVDVSSNCNGTISGSFQCEGDNFVSLTAPYGFMDYTWYADNSFAQVIGNSQSLTIDPAPPLGSVFPVIINPFPTFGCPDTLYATISAAPKPAAVAGPDRVTCSKDRVQLGAPPVNTYIYSWTPANLLSDPSASNPVINTNLLVPTPFILKTTNIVTNCFSYDTVLINPIVVDTASNMVGRTEYCPGETLNNVLTVSNPSSTVQWWMNNAPASGGTTLSLQPLVPGSYWAQIRQNGCVDSSRLYTIAYSPVPKADFSINRAVQCLNKPVVFSNKTSYFNNDLLTYLWRFSDGTQTSVANPEKSFAITGDASATLVAVSPAGCRDSTSKNLVVLKECGVLMPSAFTPNNDGLNDVIKPNLAGVEGMKRFSIFNRHGEMVFSTTKEGVGWDGRYKGVPLDTGVFVWVLEYYLAPGQPGVQKGTILLLR